MVKKFLYIKYGELTLKGKNRINFIDRLAANVSRALKSFNSVEIKREFDNMSVFYSSRDEKKIIEILKRVPGIFQIIIAYQFTFKSIDDIGNTVVKQIKKIDFNTFRVETKRHDKSFPIQSMEISRQIGGYVLKAYKDKKVKMEEYDLCISLEVKKNLCILYYEKINGCGGFPIGINGRCLVLISGGIDSPVAASLIMKKGMHVDFLTFITPPHTSDKVVDKVKKLIDKITLDGKLEKPTLYVCNFTHIQHELSHISDKSYQITLMRRYFLRIANALKNQNKYEAIGTGESLGQVASQTIQSMQAIENVLDDNCVILRPLLTYDKLEIIKLAKEIDTYNVSIIPYEDCCSLFVPKSPVTKPSIKYAKKLEAELELLDKLFVNTLNKYIKILD